MGWLFNAQCVLEGRFGGERGRERHRHGRSGNVTAGEIEKVALRTVRHLAYKTLCQLAMTEVKFKSSKQSSSARNARSVSLRKGVS